MPRCNFGLGGVHPLHSFFLCMCNLQSLCLRGRTSKICISHVLMDLLLSITVSLPTSKHPISLGSMLYFCSRDATTVKLREFPVMNICDSSRALHETHSSSLQFLARFLLFGLGGLVPKTEGNQQLSTYLIDTTSSTSLQNAMQSCPSPIVYFPLLAPS